MCHKHLIVPIVIGALFVLGACQSTIIIDGQEVPADELIAADHPIDDPVNAMDLRIGAVVDSIAFDRGTKLLHDLQWLISKKDLAIPSVIEALVDANDRTRANLLYVLGFTRTSESTKALVEHLNHPQTVVRFEAAAGLLTHGELTATPVLIAFLESEDKQMRFKAIQALSEGTGRTFDFRFAAPSEIRNVSVSQWQSWWKTEKQRLMYRPIDETTTAVSRSKPE